VSRARPDQIGRRGGALGDDSVEPPATRRMTRIEEQNDAPVDSRRRDVDVGSGHVVDVRDDQLEAQALTIVAQRENRVPTRVGVAWWHFVAAFETSTEIPCESDAGEQDDPEDGNETSEFDHGCPPARCAGSHGPGHFVPGTKRYEAPQE